MNTDKARKLRKKIYGDMSQRVEREYIVEGGKTVTKNGKKLRVRGSGTVRNAPQSLRAKYQAAKRLAMALSAILGLLVASGCTIKASGEMSIMKKWDRPAEVTRTSTEDVHPQATTKTVPTEVPR